MKLHYCKNQNDELFSMTFIYPVGSYHSPNLDLAAQQVKLLGTDRYSAAELAQEMYKLGMSYSVSVGQKETSINFSGLSSQIDTSFKLLNYILSNLNPNQAVADALIQKTLQLRENSLKNPRSILWNGLQNYAVYGRKSPLMDGLSNDKLKLLRSEELLESFQSIFIFSPQILFYGESDINTIISLIEPSKFIKGNKTESPNMDYERVTMDKTKIVLLDYDLKTSEILLLSRGTPFKKSELAANNVFNEYYGGGMSSVIFQEIREKKALAYAAFAVHTSAKDTSKPQYTYAYLGTQTDKTLDAIKSMLNVLGNMPKDSVKFEQSVSSKKQQLASSRTTRAGKLSSFWANKKLGFDASKNEQIYNELDNLTLDDIVKFHSDNVGENQYTIVIVSNLKELDIKQLKGIGDVDVVTVDDLYPY